MVRQAKESLYSRILADMRRQVLGGHWAPGMQLSKETELAERYGVSRMTMIRPLFTAGGQISPQIRINMDYRDDTPSLTDEFPLTIGSGGSTWDIATWDSGTWGGTGAPFNNWYAATGIGTVASVNMVTQTRTQAILNAFDIKAEVSRNEAL